jgi:DNA-binding transcriptional ArsR family regulator
MGTAMRRQPLDRTLGAVVSHPLRAACLRILNERIASPKELARALGEEDVGNVAYHVRVLLKLKKIQLVDQKPRRGATEHFYRAVERPFVDTEEFEALPPKDRQRFIREILEEIFADATEALSVGTMCERADMSMNRFPTSVDEEGWRELAKLMWETQQKAFDIQARTDERASKDPDGKRIPARVVCMAFEMPEPNPRG